MRWKAPALRRAARRRLVPSGVAALALLGVLAGVLVAARGGPPHSAVPGPAAAQGQFRLPAARPPHGPALPVLPGMPLTLRAGATLLAGSAVPAVQTARSGAPTVAPLRRTVRPDLLVVAPSALPARLLGAVSRLPGLLAAESVDAVQMRVNGAQTAVLGVDPSRFRAFAPRPTGAANALWQGVADGGIAVSYEMGKLDKIPLGGSVLAAGRETRRLPVVAFGTLGIGGVNAVVSDATARALGAPAGNAVVVSVTAGDFTADSAAVRRLLPAGAAAEPLVSLVNPGTGPGAPPPAPAAAVRVMLRAALSRQGMPYVWGGAGPASFDCSGLVQWSFAQARISMPRVAADQALSGPAVPVSQLAPGDLLFYRTDPTAPGYISHVAIYLGNGWMIQAPQPGMDVQVVPAAFGPQFAGAVRVSPARAASLAAGLG